LDATQITRPEATILRAEDLTHCRKLAALLMPNKK